MCTGQLPTSNLKLTAIIDTLNDLSATSLSDVSLSGNVNKYGLNSVYCPGTDADARLLNLQTDKVMSYFKDYKHTPYACDFYITSGGYSADTVLYQIGLNAVEGVFKLNYQAYSVKDYFDLYDGNDIIDGTLSPVSGGPYSGDTYDTEYNWPLWYYHDGSTKDTIFIRTYTPNSGTAWKFSGGCPFEAVSGQDYTQQEGIAHHYNLTTSFTVNVTCTDSVYVRAYSPSRSMYFEKNFASSGSYLYDTGGTPIDGYVIVAYSRNNSQYTINITD